MMEPVVQSIRVMGTVWVSAEDFITAILYEADMDSAITVESIVNELNKIIKDTKGE